jgi:transposase-like protein
MEQKRYSNEQRAAIIEQMMPPLNRSVAALAREHGVTTVTLRHWRTVARQSQLVPGDGRASGRWSSVDKFRVVLETSVLSEFELAQYCRSKVVLPEQVAQWRLACEQANALPGTKEGARALGASGGAAAPSLNSPSLAAQKKIQALERELRRKDAALAETAALLVLGKKADAIWDKGGEE